MAAYSNAFYLSLSYGDAAADANVGASSGAIAGIVVAAVLGALLLALAVRWLVQRQLLRKAADGETQRAMHSGGHSSVGSGGMWSCSECGGRKRGCVVSVGVSGTCVEAAAAAGFRALTSNVTATNNILIIVQAYIFRCKCSDTNVTDNRSQKHFEQYSQRVRSNQCAPLRPLLRRVCGKSFIPCRRAVLSLARVAVVC